MSFEFMRKYLRRQSCDHAPGHDDIRALNRTVVCRRRRLLHFIPERTDAAVRCFFDCEIRQGRNPRPLHESIRSRLVSFLAHRTGIERTEVARQLAESPPRVFSRATIRGVQYVAEKDERYARRACATFVWQCTDRLPRPAQMERTVRRCYKPYVCDILLFASCSVCLASGESREFSVAFLRHCPYPRQPGGGLGLADFSPFVVHRSLQTPEVWPVHCLSGVVGLVHSSVYSNLTGRDAFYAFALPSWIPSDNAGVHVDVPREYLV